MDVARTSTRKLTYEDFLRFPDDGQRHELIDGEHYVTPSPNTRHQALSLRMAVAIANHLEAHPQGQVFCAPYDCVFTAFDIVEPDIVVVTADQIEIITEQHVKGVPALVVEILSPGTRRVDLRIKRELYERVGVREYWIVDPVANRIAIHRRADGGLLQAADLSDADTLTTPLLPLFALDLAEFFR
jgi:Uma2 family endonuclease